MVLTFPFAGGRAGWRVVHVDGVPALSLDVGPSLVRSAVKPLSPPGRERIRSGAEKLLNNFDPPVKSEIPFVPTDRQSLRTILNEDDQKAFMAAEGMLYKGMLTSAEDAFAGFAATAASIRPLALYRLAEAQYRLQKYSQALISFREAEKAWGEFMHQSPAVMFYYGDSIARNGDLPGGRSLLAKLIIANSDKKYAPILLVRMADVLARQGREQEALAIYKTVAGGFADNKAHQVAQLKLADRSFLVVTPDNYRQLADLYQEIAATTADFDLREEATFKQALLEAINGTATSALQLTINYQKRYPKGVYGTVIKDIRDDLTALAFKEDNWSNNPAGLLRLATDNQEYLSVAVKNADFLPAVSLAFDKAGRPLDMIALYAGLLERPWLDETNAAYLTLQIADQAELLGDVMMAKKVLQGFLLRYPGHEQLRRVKERLGILQYAAGEKEAAKSNLAWVLDKHELAVQPISYYYLGRLLWDAKDYRQAALAMELYLAAAKGMKSLPPLVSDAHYVAANARYAIGDRKSAIQLLESGLQVISRERKEQFWYRLGEISMVEGHSKRAAAFFEKVIKEGQDPDWQRLARLALQEYKARPTSPAASKK